MEPRRAIYYLAVLLITLCGCQNLVPHDTPSLLNPEFQRSEFVDIVAEFWNDFCRCAGLGRDAQATVKCGHEPKDDGNHGCLSGSVGLLRLVDSFATGDRMELNRGVDQFPKCRRVPSFRPQRKSRTKEGAWELTGGTSVSLKRARSWKRRIQPKEAYSSPGLLYSETCAMASLEKSRKLTANRRLAWSLFSFFVVTGVRSC